MRDSIFQSLVHQGGCFESDSSDTPLDRRLFQSLVHQGGCFEGGPVTSLDQTTCEAVSAKPPGSFRKPICQRAYAAMPFG